MNAITVPQQQTSMQAIVPRNVPEHRIVIAQSRALRSLDRGIPLGTAISRAVAWARCAVDPGTPA